MNTIALKYLRVLLLDIFSPNAKLIKNKETHKKHRICQILIDIDYSNMIQIKFDNVCTTEKLST